MSVEAVRWALAHAPDVAPSRLAVLIGLAEHAHSDGRAAYPSQRRLAFYARKSVRAVQNDLAALAALGLIRRGDQRHTAHLSPDRRPVVWDLALERRRPQPGPPDEDQSHGPQAHAAACETSRRESPFAPAAERHEATYRPGRSPVPHGTDRASHEPSLNRPEPNTRRRDRESIRSHADAHTASRALRCPLHIGELAAHCRPCASERKAAPPAVLCRPRRSAVPAPGPSGRVGPVAAGRLGGQNVVVNRWDRVDELIRDGLTILAIRQIRTETGCSLQAAVDLFHVREKQLDANSREGGPPAHVARAGDRCGDGGP